ncbi:MAG: hypothetical protein NUV85_02240 [Candidatus Berkelbacteria bacterium]|nr:hypothetical protein [Candidatus Berkelbacteria bacterium]
MPEMLKQLGFVSDLEGKIGGMFCLMDEATGLMVIEPTKIGEIANGKKGQYTAFCREKATRLRENRANGHFQSWESRDPESDKWGGAISDGNHIWSFSGLTEEQDEALMLMSAHSCGRIMNGAPHSYAEGSNNRIILDNDYLFWLPKIVFEDLESDPEEGGEGFDQNLPEDPTPGPFVISPITAGRYRPRPGQPIVKGL